MERAEDAVNIVTNPGADDDHRDRFKNHGQECRKGIIVEISE